MRNLIIDGSNIEYRNFHIINNNGANNMITSTGINVSNVNAVIINIKNLCKIIKPDAIYVGFDKAISSLSNFRKEGLNGEYKSGRTKPDNIQELYDQEIIITKMLKSLGIKVLFPYRMECDDILSWLSATLDGDNIIASVDGDFNQLVSENVQIYHLSKKKYINVDNFTNIVGVNRKNFLVYKAIIGDPSDNIKGVRGYGKIRSKKLAENWDVENISNNIVDIVEKNVQLMDLSIGYKYYPEEVASYETQLYDQSEVKFNEKEFKRYCTKYELQNIINDMFTWKKVFKKEKKSALAEMINLYY